MAENSKTRPKFFLREEFWSLLLTGFFYIYNLIYFSVKGKMFVNSDASFEMILSNLLNKEGGILSRNWYYSSELRVLNTQLVYKIGLMLFPNNWHAARTFSIAVFMLILIAAGVFFMWALGYFNKSFFFAAILICPFGKWYAWNVIYNSYYVPHIAISLVSLGLLFAALKTGGKVKRILYIVLLMVLGFIAGLGGARQPMVCYAPLFLGCLIVFLINTKKGEKWKMLALSAGVLISSGAGFAVNSYILPKFYTFKDYNETVWNEFTLQPVWTVLEQFIRQFGWQKNVEFFSLAGMVNMGCLALFAAIAVTISLLAVKEIKESRGDVAAVIKSDSPETADGTEESVPGITDKEETNKDIRKILIFYIVSAFFMLLFIFSETWVYNESYWLPLVPFFFVPLLMVLEIPGHKKRGIILTAVLCIYLTLSCVAVSRNPYLEEIPIDLQLHTVAEWIKNSGYTKGIGAFWRSGMITELTDGKVDFWTVQNVNSMEPIAWLQEKSHVENFPDDEFFVLMSASEFEDPMYQKPHVRERQVYNDGNFVLVVFDNYSQFLQLTME